MLGFYAAICSVFDRARLCKNCRKKQVVSAKDRDRTVTCKYCGEDIPPPRKR